MICAAADAAINEAMTNAAAVCARTADLQNEGAGTPKSRQQREFLARMMREKRPVRASRTTSRY